jgi:hypothetical protein
VHPRANRGTHVDPNFHALGCAHEAAHNTNTNGGTHVGTTSPINNTNDERPHVGFNHQHANSHPYRNAHLLLGARPSRMRRADRSYCYDGMRRAWGRRQHYMFRTLQRVHGRADGRPDAATNCSYGDTYIYTVNYFSHITAIGLANTSPINNANNKRPHVGSNDECPHLGSNYQCANRRTDNHGSHCSANSDVQWRCRFL